MSLLTAATSLVNFGQRQLDRLVPPESRQKVYARVQDFAAERPLLFSFIVVQAVVSVMPVFLFLSFLCFLIFLAATAALLFSVFWTMIAIFILVPALGITTSIGLFLWSMGLAAFFTARTGFTGLRRIAAAPEPQKRGRDLDEVDGASPPVEPTDSSSSSFPLSWTNVDGQDIKQENGAENKQTVLAHPDAGSDLDALET
ncbi:hypothetical protein N657DRAFT_582174 [Parathielavia appendiculata]|uniref:Uncharacterized protein n=1 Tax=Parathielavia appendiculata TaxID=2587402 RepID=A0AAN6TRY3_9PEZI|nr:hypothetical protein N657DRAFT_582174 [Parathielavia appendiculata]